jgi:hypothetical protein
MGPPALGSQSTDSDDLGYVDAFPPPPLPSLPRAREPLFLPSTQDNMDTAAIYAQPPPLSQAEQAAQEGAAALADMSEGELAAMLDDGGGLDISLLAEEEAVPSSQKDERGVEEDGEVLMDSFFAGEESSIGRDSFMGGRNGVKRGGDEFDELRWEGSEEVLVPTQKPRLVRRVGREPKVRFHKFSVSVIQNADLCA